MYSLRMRCLSFRRHNPDIRTLIEDKTLTYHIALRMNRFSRDDRRLIPWFVFEFEKRGFWRRMWFFFTRTMRRLLFSFSRWTRSTLRPTIVADQSIATRLVSIIQIPARTTRVQYNVEIYVDLELPIVYKHGVTNKASLPSFRMQTWITTR